MGLALFATYLHADFLLGLYFDPEYGGDGPPKHRLTYNGLHGVIAQKTQLLITSGVRTSEPAFSFHLLPVSVTQFQTIRSRIMNW
jgi:hypothetical protein